MRFNKKAWVKFFQWSKWLGVAALVGAVSLGYSWRSYSTSQKKGQEVGIAQVGTEGAKSGWIENTVTFPQAGKVFIYYWQLKETPGLRTLLRFWTKLKVDKEDFQLNGLGEKKKESDWPVKADTEKRYAIWNYPKSGHPFDQPVGFKPVTNKKCGTIDVTAKLQKARENGQKIAQARCWEAWDQWFKPAANPLDYSDFLLIFAVKPTGSPSPGVSPSPSPKVSPSPSPAPKCPAGKACFRILKYNDKDGNGVRDKKKEASTGKEWVFKYKVGERELVAIKTAAKSGLSEKIVVDKGSKITVEEVAKKNWKQTEPKTKTKIVTLTEAKNYAILFGNHWLGASPSPSASPDKASFRIRKFNDKNNNGELDSDEASTEKEWEFKYKIGDGEWVTGYKTNASTGLGQIIKVAKGREVTVEEIEQSGWEVTTDKTQTKTLSEAKLYGFAFGNWEQSGGESPSPSPSPAASFPPKQPDTGSPTWLTVGAAGVGLVLLTVRLLIKF